VLLLLALAFGAVFLLVELFDSRLYFVFPARHYLVLHTLLELAGILVSFAVFIANWEASKLNRNAQSLFIATGFLAVAAFSTMHTLSYPGMPDFLTLNTVGKGIYYWLAASYWSAGVLLAAVHVSPNSRAPWLRRYFLAFANLLACAIVLAVVTLMENRLPAMFVEDQGLTPLKVALEYGAIGLSLAALVAHARLYRTTGDEFFILIVAALVVNILSGLALSAYRSPYDTYNLLAHLYKVASYYLIFRALLVSSVQRPYIQLSVANERLERTVAELDARNRELDALDEIAVAMSSTLKPSEILEAAIDKVMAVMEADAGAIFLLSDGTDRLRLAVWKGLAPAVVEACHQRPLRLPEEPHNAKVGIDSPIKSFDLVGNDGRTMGRTAPMGICSCAAIVSKGRRLGYVAVVSREGKSFTVRDADLLTAIGYQLGLAIENAQLYEQTDERLREKVHELEHAERRSRFLSEVGALLGGAEDLGKALDRVVRMSTELMGDWCSLYLLDDREKQLWLEASYHPDVGYTAIEEVMRRRPIGMGEGLVGRVALTGEPVLVARLSGEEVAAEVQEMAQSPEEVALLRRLTPVSRIAAPLRARGGTVGVLLTATTASRQPLGESDLPLVIDLADRIGMAIENRRLFQESQAQRRHLEAIISQMVDGVVVTDEVGEVSVANASAQRMLGHEMERLLGCRQGATPGGPVGPNEPGPTAKMPLVRRALDGDLVMGESIKVAGPAGEKVLSASASPIRNEAGRIIGAVVAMRDVTAEREVERIKDEFVAVVSHELRTPITAVMGYTDILLRGLRGPLAPKQVEALGSVRSAAQRLLELINDLLDTSRLEAGKQELFLSPVDLFAASDRALMAVSVLAASKAIRLVHAVPRGLPTVLADEEQLQRILGNLLSNAIKFTPEGGTITLAAETREEEAAMPSQRSPRGAGSVAVMISDTGVGIPPEHQEKIWDKFHQVDSSSRRLFGGTGLGLAITKGLVELHGGRVWVESEGIPGRGSTFGFTLPVAPHHD
jgi:signal transduction histidine kinase/GAF domain-containing protein